MNWTKLKIHTITFVCIGSFLAFIAIMILHPIVMIYFMCTIITSLVAGAIWWCYMDMYKSLTIWFKEREQEKIYQQNIKTAEDKRIEKSNVMWTDLIKEKQK